MIGMKKRNKKKNSNPWLKWIVGLGLTAISLVSLIVTILVFNSGLFQMSASATPLTTLPEGNINFGVPTAISIPTGTADPDLTLALATATEGPFEFDASTANQVLPEDVLEEVFYFGRGAGVCNELQGSSPQVSQEPRDTELMMESRLVACGWEKDEVLTGIIQYPDGRIITRSIPVQVQESIYYGVLSLIPTLDDPVGPYTFTLQGQRGVVTAIAEFHEPQGPRLYALASSHILFYQFAPQESVRLLCYDSGGRFVAWQEIKVDQDGNRSVVVKTDGCSFAALGESSGEVHIVENGYPDTMSHIRGSCGGLRSRLKISDGVRVAFTDGLDQPVRSEPGYSQEVENSIPEGTVIQIVTGPECANGSIWWLIMNKGQLLGWIAEEQNGIYLLEAVP